MKNLLLPIAAALLTLTSCMDDPKQPENTLQYQGEMPTCIIPLDANDDSQVSFTSLATYTFTNYTLNGYWTLGGYGIPLPGMPTLRFTSPKLSALIDIYTGGYNYVFNMSTAFAGDNGESISSFVGTFIQNYYYYTGENVINVNPKPLGQAQMTMAFTVNDKYQVRMFPKTAYYGGALVTRYTSAGGDEKTYTNTTPIFGVEVDLGAKTATITMHNIKFAEEMPFALDIIRLPNLPLSGDLENGYKIEAKNIIPTVGLGSNATPYPNYTFDEIEMHPTNSQMTNCEIEFKVAGQYEGEFTGSIAR